MVPNCISIYVAHSTCAPIFCSPVVNFIMLKCASLGINGDHFVIQDGGQVPCR